MAAPGVKHAPAADAARDCFYHLEVAGADERIGDHSVLANAGYGLSGRSSKIASMSGGPAPN